LLGPFFEWVKIRLSRGKKKNQKKINIENLVNYFSPKNSKLAEFTINKQKSPYFKIKNDKICCKKSTLRATKCKSEIIHFQKPCVNPKLTTSYLDSICVASEP
jgi:hypothetical protein